MNKKILPVIIILLLLGVGGFFYMRSKGIGPLGTQTGSESGGAKSLKDLLSSGVAQKCTFSTTDESGASEGTTYVSGGKVRGDFTSVMDGKTTKSHMITDGKTSYIWTDGEKTGFKTTVTESETADTPDKSVDNDIVAGSVSDFDQKTDYKCSAWVVEGSYFTPPTDVKFTDLSEMFNPSAVPTSGSGGGTTGASSQCAVCDSLTGTDKTECLSALNCK